MPIIVKPQFALINPPEYITLCKHVERAARTCYKSEPLTSKDVSSAESIITRLIRMGHGSVLEHVNLSVRFICDKAITHELVRHRVGVAFSQESSRFCSYNKDKFGNSVAFILPLFWENDPELRAIWEDAITASESAYMLLLSKGATAQEARSVLSHSLKTEIVVTANIRQWRLIFAQRCAEAAHPQIQQIMLPLLSEANHRFPVFFNDVFEMFKPRFDFFKKRAWALAEMLPDEIDFLAEVFTHMDQSNDFNIA